jgi:hypothetical protein
MTKAAAAAAAGKNVRGSGDLFLYSVVAKKNSLCIFSILMFGKEAVCPDSLFVPAVFRELGFYLNSFFFQIKTVVLAYHAYQYA